GLGVVVAAVGAWGAVGWGTSGGPSTKIGEFIVTPRTFSVVLKEKGELKAANSVDIKCEVEGRSTIISIIEEGNAVKKGDLLVELASDQLDTRIRQEELKEATAFTAYEAAKTDLDIQRDKNASDIRKGELQVELKKLELEKYTQGEWDQKRRDAEIRIEEAQITLKRAKEDFEAAGELLKRKFITQTEFQNDEFAHSKAIWELEKARKAKDVLEHYTHVAELRQRESDYEEAIKELERDRKNAIAEETKKIRHLEGKKKELEINREQLAKSREQKENCRIIAPASGFVVYYSESWRWGNDNQIKEGASVFERQILLQLPDTSEMEVIARIHEAKMDKVSVGQAVVIEVEGIPDRQFTGKITKIAALADTQNRWLNPDLKEYETEITLDPTDVPLKPGVTAHAKILVEDVIDKLAVPVQAVYAKDGRRYVFRTNGSTTEPIEVQVGSVGSQWAEITAGISEGDRVLLAFSDEHTRLIPDAPPEARRHGGSRDANVSDQPKRKAPGRRSAGRGGVKKARGSSSSRKP
ncbi:MAG: efflux RND transporter periplasmic adaptor subunit, partial [Planctomycetes bacterium]|nr:efflux RND transporter periplasmic adaptor subunit [Planctomycetota bacterium]